MTRWIVRAVVPRIVVWAAVAYVLFAAAEIIVFGRFEPTEYVPGAIGTGIGFAFAQRAVSSPRES